MTPGLFDELPAPYIAAEPIAPGAALLRGFALDQAEALRQAAHQVIAAAHLRHLITPGGRAMSVGMTNCGALGWTSSSTGYRYTSTDPLSGQPWPPMPACFADMAARAAAEAGFDGFRPDACLINRLMFSARIWREEVRVSIPGTLPSSLSLPDPNETDFLSFVACLQCAFIASYSRQSRREDTGISFYSN